MMGPMTSGSLSAESRHDRADSSSKGNRLVTLRSAFVGQLDRSVHHPAFGVAAALGNLLDDMAVAVTGGKIHFALDASRILTQDLLDHTQRLDENTPIHRPQGTEAADSVAHGDLIGGLLLVLRLYQLLARPPGFGKSLFDPGERQGQVGPLPLQPAR
jgi:hypothetical protein